MCWLHKQVFFSLSRRVFITLLIFNEVLKWGKKNREDLSCFYLFICGTLYIDWKSHLLWIKRTLYIITQTGQLTATFVRETWQRSRDRKKKCATNFFSLFSCGKYNATDGDGYIEFENRNNYRPESVNGLCKHESWRRGKWLSTYFIYIFQAPSRTCPLPPPKKIIRTLHLYHNPPPKKKWGVKDPPFISWVCATVPSPPSPPKKKS